MVDLPASESFGSTRPLARVGLASFRPHSSTPLTSPLPKMIVRMVVGRHIRRPRVSRSRIRASVFSISTPASSLTINGTRIPYGSLSRSLRKLRRLSTVRDNAWVKVGASLQGGTDVAGILPGGAPFKFANALSRECNVACVHRPGSQPFLKFFSTQSL